MINDKPGIKGNVGFVSTRLAGTDGVSLETEKWAHVSYAILHERLKGVLADSRSM